MSEHPESFHYTYSAREQEEVRQIREKYAPKEEPKLEQLRRLDKSAEKPGTIAAIVVGVLGTLLLGLGMSCTMVWGGALFVPGIVIGVVGIGGVAAAYPLYLRMTKQRREQLAPEILRLANELSQN